MSQVDEDILFLQSLSDAVAAVNKLLDIGEQRGLHILRARSEYKHNYIAFTATRNFERIGK